LLIHNKGAQLHYLNSVFCPAIVKFINKHGVSRAIVKFINKHGVSRTIVKFTNKHGVSPAIVNFINKHAVSHIRTSVSTTTVSFILHFISLPDEHRHAREENTSSRLS
jgi:hypothetical protein